MIDFKLNLSLLNKFSSSKEKPKKYEKIIEIIGKIIETKPEEYEKLEDIRIDIMEGIPLSAKKKEILQKSFNDFKENRFENQKEEKSDSNTHIDISKIEDHKIFIEYINENVEILLKKYEKITKEVDQSAESESLETAKNDIEYDCKLLISEIFQVQNKLDDQLSILKNIQTKLNVVSERIKRNLKK